MLNIVVLSIPIYFLLIGAELMVQQFSRRQIYRLNDAITNISCGITQQLSGVFFKVLSLGAYYLVYEHLRIATIPGNWLTWILLFVAVDFCYYWAHRMSHEINLFWGGHVVHHQSEDYNLSVALRQSSFQILWTFAFYLPLAVIGFGPEEFIITSALVTVYQFWIHTETIGKLGFLELFLNTPSHHRVHHGRNPNYIDKNHAGVFIIWDRMFGTFQKEEERPTYGITTPVKSWNPVWVNLQHYYQMARELSLITGIKNKLKYIFYKPGWLPQELGGYRAAPPIDKNHQKFDVTAGSRINLYILFHYLLVLAGSAYFLFNMDALEVQGKLLGTTAIIISVLTAGALIEQRTWAPLLEVARVISVTMVAVYFFYPFGFSLAFGGTVIYFVVSITWLWYLYRPVKSVEIT